MDPAMESEIKNEWISLQEHTVNKLFLDEVAPSRDRITIDSRFI